MTTGTRVIQLEDGTATTMGDGVFVIAQWDEHDMPQSVVVNVEDLRKMLAALSA